LNFHTTGTGFLSDNRNNPDTGRYFQNARAGVFLRGIIRHGVQKFTVQQDPQHLLATILGLNMIQTPLQQRMV
jgi:hypothetical protein